MIALLMGLIGELVFGSAAAVNRDYETEIGRYMDKRGLRPKAAKKPTTG